MSSVLVRRLVGTVAAILLIAGGRVLVTTIGAPPSGSYEVVVELGSHAGKGLDPGSDVKVRGVLTGTVKDIRLDDQANAVVTLIIWPLQALPRDVQVVVTAKTFLGEKQIELRPRTDVLASPPYLQDGDVLRVAEEDEPAEVQELIAAFEPVLDAIDPVDLAAVIDTFGSFDREDALTAGRNIEVGAELADFGARTAQDQLARLSSLATLTGELATTAEDFNRLSRSLPVWTSILPDRQADVRANLEALSEFSLTLADFLEVEETTIRDVLAVTTTVNGVLAGQSDDLSLMIHSIYRYAFKLGRHGGFLNDGTDHGWFRGFMGNEGQLEELCRDLPEPFADIAPGCVPEDDEEGGGEGSEGQPGAGGDEADGGDEPPLPTEAPTGIPTTLPTELPTDLLSDVPLREPSGSGVQP